MSFFLLDGIRKMALAEIELMQGPGNVWSQPTALTQTSGARYNPLQLGPGTSLTPVQAGQGTSLTPVQAGQGTSLMQVPKRQGTSLMQVPKRQGTSLMQGTAPPNPVTQLQAQLDAAKQQRIAEQLRRKASQNVSIPKVKAYNKMGRFGRFIGRHPKGAILSGLALAAGGAFAGANVLAKQKQGEWYNQGHQAATRTYAPIINARTAPQGAMNMSGYGRRV